MLGMREGYHPRRHVSDDAVNLLLLLPIGILISVAVMLVIGFVMSGVTRYEYPDGSCGIVVEIFLDGSKVPHDCGWEQGRSYDPVYIQWGQDLAVLYSR